MNKVYEFYEDQICVLKALGMTIKQIADYLYDNYEISYIERDILKEGAEEDEQN